MLSTIHFRWIHKITFTVSGGPAVRARLEPQSLSPQRRKRIGFLKSKSISGGDLLRFIPSPTCLRRCRHLPSQPLYHGRGHRLRDNAEAMEAGRAPEEGMAGKDPAVSPPASDRRTSAGRPTCIQQKDFGGQAEVMRSSNTQSPSCLAVVGQKNKSS